MAKVQKVFLWLSIVLGGVGAIVALAGLYFGGALHYFSLTGTQWIIVLICAVAFAGPFGFVWLIYPVYKAIKYAAAKDTRPHLLVGPQIVVVWVMALLLTAVSILYGLVDAWVPHLANFIFNASAILWLGVFPILLMDAALFLHIMRRKE
jgi:hypothetical protein